MPILKWKLNPFIIFTVFVVQLACHSLVQVCFKCQVCFGHNDVFKSDCFKILIFKVKNLNIKFNLSIYCFNLIILKFYLGSI